MARLFCGCGRTFRTEKQLLNHLNGKKPSMHTGWPGHVLRTRASKPTLEGGARPIIDDEKPDKQLLPGPSVPMLWHHGA